MFTIEERVEMVLLFGQIRTYQGTARQFNENHPEHQVSRNGVANLISKFQRTGSVIDEHWSGRPTVDEVVEVGVFAELAINPQQSARVVARNQTYQRGLFKIL